MKQLAERGAYALLRLTSSGGSYSHGAWVRHAPIDVLSKPAPIDVHAWEHCDAWLGVAAPENTHDRADIAPARTNAVQRAYSDAMSRLTVDASADSEEEFLLETLDTDEGAHRIGELGIGCNRGIDRYMRNLYFDEKINGTVHIALGMGFDYLGGTNESAIHWDIVKDLRSGGRIELDGRIVQEDGAWVV